jgi:hypothetical protein
MGCKTTRRPADVVGVTNARVVGNPQHISTSYIERQNVILRMQDCRFTRVTNAFSKKLENLAGAAAFYVALRNLCRVHEALRVTPAMQLRAIDYIWRVGEPVDVALSGAVPQPTGRRVGRFVVIDGGHGE